MADEPQVGNNRLVILLLVALLGTGGAQTLATYGITRPPVVATAMVIDAEFLRQFDKGASQIEELHRWHDVVDESGVRLWYGRTLNVTMEEILDQNREQTQLLERILAVTRVNGRY